MKHKTLKRVLCFLLALVVVASMPLDIHANAVAIELGWVTWALVSYLAASGFAFAVTGGIQALQTEVEQQVDEYYTVTGIDLFQLIAQSLKMRPPNGGGLGNGFWFGAATVAAIADFIDWVRNNGWSSGEVTEQAVSAYNGQLRLGGYSLADVQFSYSTTIEQYSPPSSGLPYYLRDVVVARNHYYPNDLPEFFYVGSTTTKQYCSNNYEVYRLYDDGSRTDIINTQILGELLDHWGYSYSDIEFATISAGSSNCTWVLVLNDGRGISSSFNNEYYYSVPVNISSTITSPSTVTEFDVQADEYVEIDFPVFENEATFSEPQELAEAVKQQIIDTGTTPQTITEVKTETNPQPSPQPSPELPTPETPVYPDVEGLGLPALGTLLMTKWPFCIPHDIARVINIFNAPRQTPVWEVDLYDVLGDRVPFAGDTTLRIDLTEYEALGTITRWITLIGWCLTLLLITKQVQDW